MRSSNPALSEKVFRNFSRTTDERMSLSGTVNKSFILITLVIASAFWSWQNAYSGGWSQESVPQIPSWYFVLIIGTLILSFVIVFKKEWAPYLAPVYAVGEGVLLGTISALFDYRYPGVVLQAVLCTLGVFLALLFLYKTRVIQATKNVKLGIVAATMGVVLVYLADMVLRFFGNSVPFLHESSTMGIVVSAIIVGVAAMNLILDFDFIEQGAERGAPQYMEWYAAFGLLITLVWLYMEMLRLLGKTRRR
jgi:uncharacterized YccA/Bax inhibitor family protein